MSFFWSRARTIPMKYPFAFGVAFSTMKTSFSDLLVQKVVEQRETIDWKRNSAFATFGCFYLGGVQYAIYVNLFGRMFPNAAAFAAKSIRDKLRDPRGMFNTVAQVFLDQCVHHPLMYFPVFYCIKESVVKEEPNYVECLQEYRQNFWEDLFALWKIWVPATFLNFSFMPMWGRIPTVASVSLLWTCVLSTMRGGDVAHKQELAGAPVTGETFRIVREGWLANSFRCPVELDPQMQHLCLTASGPDKVGLVAKLARVVSDNQGNVTYSNMVRLGQDFIVVMHVAFDGAAKQNLVEALTNTEELEDLNIRSTSLSRRDHETHHTKPSMGLRIHCMGEDRPGMLAAVAEQVSSKGMLIENVSTQLRMNHDGRRQFVVDADCTTGHDWDAREMDGIVADLSGLKETLGLEVLDMRIHKMNES